MVLANLRVQHGPLVATLVEGHHEGALHAACGRSRVLDVMTTTLRVLRARVPVPRAPRRGVHRFRISYFIWPYPI